MCRSTSSKLRFSGEEEALHSDIEEDGVRFAVRGNEEQINLNICCPESQRGDQPLQSCVFLRGRNTLLGN